MARYTIEIDDPHDSEFTVKDNGQPLTRTSLDDANQIVHNLRRGGGFDGVVPDFFVAQWQRPLTSGEEALI